MLSSALEGYADESNWDLGYVEVDPLHSAANKVVIDQKCNLLHQLYRPGEGMTLGCIPSDQQVFNYISESFLNALGKTDDDPSSSFEEWAIPLISRFHAEKEDICGVVKQNIYGYGLEQLLRFTGLFAYYQQNVLRISHARRNRSILFQFATCSAIRACKVLLNGDGVARDAADFAMQTSEVKNDAAERGRTFLGPSIMFTEAVKRSDIRLGEALRDGLMRLSERIPKSNWHIRRILLESLIPSIFDFGLQRSGQTDAAEKPLYWFLPDLMFTNRLNYRERLLLYAYIKSIMPSSLYDDIYSNVPGCLTIKISGNGNKHANHQHNKCLECTIIRHTKGVKTKDLTTIYDSVAWTQHVRKAVDKLCKGAQAILITGCMRNAEEKDEFGLRRVCERDTCVAGNVQSMLEEMRRVGHLNIEHLSMGGFTNDFTREKPNTDVAGYLNNTYVTGMKVPALYRQAFSKRR